MAFIATARPNKYVFSQLHLYPGTEELHLFCRQRIITLDAYFRRDVPHLTCFAGNREDETSFPRRSPESPESRPYHQTA